MPPPKHSKKKREHKMMNETSRPDKPVMIYRKTAILQKNGIFAAVGVYSRRD